MNPIIADPDFPLLVILGVLVLMVAVVGRLGRGKILREASAKAREQLELRFTGFTGALAEMEEEVADLTRTVKQLRESMVRAAPPQPLPSIRTNGAVAPPSKASEEVSPEVLVVIAAAVTSFLGKKVRIRSAKMLQSPYEIVNPWAQQGRATIQASHNFREWGHQPQPTQHRGGFRH